eukprot:PhM_4_TR11172/c0_g2_i1/m.54007
MSGPSGSTPSPRTQQQPHSTPTHHQNEVALLREENRRLSQRVSDLENFCANIAREWDSYRRHVEGVVHGVEENVVGAVSRLESALQPNASAGSSSHSHSPHTVPYPLSAVQPGGGGGQQHMGNARGARTPSPRTHRATVSGPSPVVMPLGIDVADGSQHMGGVVVVRVWPGSHAERAALASGDVVLTLNSRTVTTRASFRRVVQELRTRGVAVLEVKVLDRMGTERLVIFPFATIDPESF